MNKNIQLCKCGRLGCFAYDSINNQSYSLEELKELLENSKNVIKQIENILNQI